jgi:DNA repair protein RadC
MFNLKKFEIMETKDLTKVAEIEISYKTKIKASERPKIATSKEAAEIFRSFYKDEHIELREEFKMMLLNRANKVLGIVEISTGGISGTVVDIRIMLATALKSLASSIILCHNHPSGNMIPSDQDKQLTSEMKQACLLCEISLLDNIILSPEEDKYYSLADEGLL